MFWRKQKTRKRIWLQKNTELFKSMLLHTTEHHHDEGMSDVNFVTDSYYGRASHIIAAFEKFLNLPENVCPYVDDFSALIEQGMSFSEKFKQHVEEIEEDPAKLAMYRLLYKIYNDTDERRGYEYQAYP